MQVFPTAGPLLAIGVETSGGALTPRNLLARIDANQNRVEGVTRLPSGQLAATLGDGSLWLGRVGGSTVERLDPRSGRIVGRLRGTIGTVLAVAGEHLWTADPRGVLRRLS